MGEIPPGLDNLHRCRKALPCPSYPQIPIKLYLFERIERISVSKCNQIQNRDFKTMKWMLRNVQGPK